MPNLELVTRNSDGRKNFYDERGRIYFENWLLQAIESSNQLIRIQRSEDSLWNFFSKDGTFLTDEWFELLDDFANGFAVVKKNGRYNVVTRTGKLVFREWYKEIDCDFGVPWRVRKLDGKYSIVDKQLKFVARKWYDDVTPFVNGFAKVKKSTKPTLWSYVGEDGKMISRAWFESVEYFYGEAKMARVQRKWDLLYNYIRRDGTLASDTWFAEAAISAYDGWALIQRVGDFKYNYINENGELLSKLWFTEACEFQRRNSALVCSDEKKWNYITPDGKFVLEKWYDKIDDCGVLAYCKDEEDLEPSIIFF